MEKNGSLGSRIVAAKGAESIGDERVLGQAGI